jgi:hypothetical protein
MSPEKSTKSQYSQIQSSADSALAPTPRDKIDEGIKEAVDALQ